MAYPLSASIITHSQTGSRCDASYRQYIFNLSTQNLSQGTWYLRIDLGDSTNNIVQIKLKK